MFAERFGKASHQLSSDSADERLAGVHAMASLADDWADGRQMCIDALCAYLRMPYTPPAKPHIVSDDDAEEPEVADEAERARLAERRVRHTIVRVITEHLRDDATVSWQGHDFDLSGALFDGADFSKAVFSGGRVNLSGAVFARGRNSFSGAEISGGQVSFSGAVFSDGYVDFTYATFSGGQLVFSGAVFSDDYVDFTYVTFSGGDVDFHRAIFSRSRLDLSLTEFSGSDVDFASSVFSEVISTSNGRSFPEVVSASQTWSSPQDGSC